MIYYIADTHFGHANAIRFDNRPFADLYEMHETMVQYWNARVTKKDDVYIIGDFSYRMKSTEAKALALSLNGHKHLILGNHDKLNAEWYEGVFDEVTPYREIKDIVQGYPRKVVLSHYFIPFYNGARHMGFMLHGHTHKTNESNYEEQVKEYIRKLGFRCEAYNVGCMWQDYMPQTLEEIIARQPRKVDVI